MQRLKSRGISLIVAGLLGATAVMAVPTSALAGAASVGHATGSARLAGTVAGLPQGTRSLGLTPTTNQLTVEISLNPRDPAALDSFVAGVSTPGSPTYHQYLGPGQYRSKFGPTGATIDAVQSWMRSSGLSVGTVSSDGLLVPISGSVGKVDRAFGVTLTDEQLPSGRVAHHAAVEPEVPQALASSVAGVVGLSTVAQPTPQNIKFHGATSGAPTETLSAQPQESTSHSGPTACSGAASTASDNEAYTADQLASAYDFDALYSQGRTGAGTRVGIFELEPFDPTDIAAYESCYGISVPVSLISVDGGAGTGAGEGEAALDIEDVAGLAPATSITVYSGPNGETDTGSDDTYDRMVTDDTAKVLSTSWGECETAMDSGDRATENSIFQEAAAQGQSIFAAAGDSGSEDCYYPGQDSDSSLQVDDPADQPYVTGVGGTSLASLPASPGEATDESVWNNGCFADNCGAGGGGVSSEFTMPSWQAGPGVVNSSTPLSPCPVSSGSGTSSCREVPDVSASADPNHGYVVYWSGGWLPIGGTSAASPLWSALTTDMNQSCAAPAGQMNPKLYPAGASSTGFHDVTSGNNDMLGAHSDLYGATTHYDLASGWGTPAANTLITSIQAAGGCPTVTGLSSSQGPASGGQSVVISGSDLGTVTAVHFGSALAAIVSHTSSSVTVTSPSVGTDQLVNVSVTTPGGTTAAVAGDLYLFVGPVISSVAPTLAPIAAGTHVVISGSNLGTATSVMFGGAAALSYSASASSITAVAPAGPSGGGTVDISVTTPDGTTTRSSADHFTYVPRPVVTSVSPSSGFERGGQTVTLRGSGLIYVSSVVFGSAGPGSVVSQSGSSMVVVAPRSTGAGAVTVNIVVTNPGGVSALSGGDRFTFVVPPPGYWLVASDGGIFSFGDAGFYGSTGSFPLNRPIVGMSATADDDGYWLVASDGGIFSFGDAGFYGSTGSFPLNRPIVGMAPTPDGHGYWLVASDGGIFSFGDAGFYGSTGAFPLNKPIVSMTPTPSGHGYWLVASDGGIFSFGDAGFYGSTGSFPLNRPIVGMAPTPSGHGYWLVASDGGIFSFGDAGFYGSTGAFPLNRPIVGMSVTPSGHGYWLVASDGGIFSLGDAGFYGSTGAFPLNRPIVAMSST